MNAVYIKKKKILIYIYTRIYMLSFLKSWSNVNCFYLFDTSFSILFFTQLSGLNKSSIHVLLSTYLRNFTCQNKSEK